MFLDADHGKQLKRALNFFKQEQAHLIFLEGFTDVMENAALWRSSDKVYYDYPNLSGKNFLCCSFRLLLLLSLMIISQNIHLSQLYILL